MIRITEINANKNGLKYNHFFYFVCCAVKINFAGVYNVITLLSKLMYFVLKDRSNKRESPSAPNQFLAVLSFNNNPQVNSIKRNPIIG
jgi:hypothetical protein